jgi:hypothetical protein
MKRLGYARFAAQGRRLGCDGHGVGWVYRRPRCSALSQVAFTVPPDIDAAVQATTPPSDLSADERRAYEQLDFFGHGVAYAQEMSNRPQTLYGIGDCRWAYPGFSTTMRSATLIARVFDGQREGLRERHPRQRRSLADKHGRIVRAHLLGKQVRFLRRHWPSRSRWAPFLTRCVQARGLGRRGLPKLIHYNGPESGHFPAGATATFSEEVALVAG